MRATNPLCYNVNDSILSNIETHKGTFINKDDFNPQMPDIAAKVKISAVDEFTADIKFIKYSQEVIGFLKLFQPNYYVYFSSLKSYESDKSLIIHSNDKILCRDSYKIGTQFNRVLIDENEYELYLNNGLKWLNDEANSEGPSSKAEKIKDALYWFSYAIDEINLTNKFIYLITILECLLKDSSQKSEIATTIVERTAYILGKTKTNQIDIYNR